MYVSSRQARTVILIVEFGLLALAARTGIVHIRYGTPDFEYFYEDGKVLLTTGAISRGEDLPDSPRKWRVQDPVNPRRDWLRWYLPFIHRVCSPLGLTRWHVAGFCWVLMNLIASVLSMRWVGRELSETPPEEWPYSQFLPVLLMIVFWMVDFRLNQINLMVLCLLVGAFVAWQRGRHVSGGLLMGMAVLMKVTPTFLLLWFALKRQWRLLTAAVATIVLFGPVADVIIFGPSIAVSEYQRWYHDAVQRSGARYLIMTENNVDERNNGMAVTLCRLLHHTNYGRRFEEEPRLAYRTEPEAYANVVDLSPLVVLRISQGITLVILAALLWLCRRPARLLTPSHLRMEWALFLVVMLCLMPVLRWYHFVWAYPALAIFLGHEWRRTQMGVQSKLAYVAVGIWVLGCALGGTHLGRAVGMNLWALLFLAVAIGWRIRRTAPPSLSGAHLEANRTVRS